MPIIRLQDGFFKSLEENEEKDWCDWIDTMTNNNIPAGPVIDVIIFGDSTKGLDLKHHKTKGWTRKQLLKSLDLYGIAA
jgi:hypothetical protein